MLKERQVKKTIFKDNIVLFAEGTSFEKVNIEKIECILVNDVFTQVFFEGKKIIRVRRSLNEWGKILPQNIFIRVNRATMINLNYVKHIEKSSNKTLIIHMKNYESPVIMSRSYTSKLKDKLIIR